MSRTSTLSRLQRLELLATRLKSDAPLVLRELANELGVSHRTLSRDIDILRERGLPIEASRGRGGGVRLHWRWSIGRIALSYREAVDLLVSLAVVEQMNSPILMANLTSIRRKLMASFSPSDQHKIRHFRSRILIGQTASIDVQSGYELPSPSCVEQLHTAFLMSKVAMLRYEDERGRQTARTVEPQFLLLNYPVWYALCWDRSREAVRTLRCDRMLSVSVVHEHFQPRPKDDFREALEGIAIVET